MHSFHLVYGECKHRNGTRDGRDVYTGNEMYDYDLAGTQFASLTHLIEA